MILHKKIILLTGLFIFLTWNSLSAQDQELTIVSISATPSNTCSQQAVQLSVEAEGGTSNYSYSWVGNPGTFTSEQQSPTDFPAVNTMYTVVVNDGEEAVQASVPVSVVPYPDVDAGEDATICENTNSYMLSGSATHYSYLEWTTQGDGTFNNTGTPTATYSPGSQDKENGSVTLTLHAFSSPPCTGSESDQMTLTIASFPTVDAGDDIEICEDETVSLSAEAEDYSSLTWSSDGDGYFTNINSLESTYVPGGNDFADGSVQITLTAEALSPCPGDVADNLVVSITPQPIAEAGDDGEVCEGLNYTLSGSSDNAGSVFWSTSGDGNFQNPNQPNATYIPGTQDIQNGEVILTMTATGEGACGTQVDTDTMALQIYQQPQVEAGSDLTACESDTVVASAEAQYVQELEWSTSGDGSFIDDTLQEAEYIPGTTDIQNGEVTLMVTGYAMNPCTGSVTDELTVTFDPAPIVNAGADASSCDNTAFTLEGEAQYSSGVLWETSGDGTFDDNTVLAASYTPGPQDAQNGTAELTLTGQPEGTCQEDASDTMTLTFIAGPQVNAGNDSNICEDQTFMTSGTASSADQTEWTTSGDGSFTNPQEPVTEYEPGNEDIQNEEVYLILTGQNESCGISQDSLLLSIVPNPDVDAGSDTTFCAHYDDDSITIALQAEASNYAGLEWESDGFGTFSDNTSLSTTYTFLGEDIENQEVNLTLTAYPNTPCSEPVSDVITVSLSYHPLADAGIDSTVCEGDPIDLDGSGTLFYTAVYWFRIPEAGGEIDNPTSLVTSYTPIEEDYENESVSFRLQVENMDCAIAYDTVTFDIQRKPHVDAGDDFAICRDDNAELNASVEFATGIQWRALPGSNGSFSDESIENPVYTPGSSDISNGVARLEVSGWASLPCDTPGRDTIEITINDYPSVDLGNDIEACSGEAVELLADADNFSTFEWSTSGDGEFSVQDLSTQYTMGEADLENGEVTITFTAEPDYPCSGAVEDQVTVTIKEGAVIVLDDIISANYNESYTFEPEVTSSSDNLSFSWEPVDLLENPTEKNATTIEFPADGDSTYLFTLYVTNEDNGCVVSDTARVYLNLGDVTLNLEADPAQVCEGGSATLYPNASGGTGNYSYFWQANNSSWDSESANPVVTPTERTTYTVIVNDGNTSPSASITLDVMPNPGTPSISGEDQTAEGAEEVYTTTGSDLAYYQWWAKNGSVTEGQGTKAATIEWGASGTGIVYMSMASEYGCFGDTTEYMVSIGTISVEEIAGVSNLKIYPNPATEHLYVTFSLAQQKEVAFAVMDSRGKVVTSENSGLKGTGKHSLEIQLNEHPEGIYLLRLSIGSHHLTKRFLKLR